MRKPGRAHPARRRQRQEGQDHRRALALPFPRGRRAARRRRGRGPVAAGQGRRRGLHRDRQAAEGDGRAGRRHGSAVDQSLLVRPRARPRRPDRQDPEREAGRALRLQAGPLRRLRLAHPAGARSRGAGTRDRGEEAGPEGRRDRRHRGRRGILRSQVPSGVGQGRGARRAPVHPSARHAGARQAPQPATAGWATPSAIRWRPRSRSRT